MFTPHDSKTQKYSSLILMKIHIYVIRQRGGQVPPRDVEWKKKKSSNNNNKKKYIYIYIYTHIHTYTHIYSIYIVSVQAMKA